MRHRVGMALLAVLVVVGEALVRSEELVREAVRRSTRSRTSRRHGSPASRGRMRSSPGSATSSTA